MIFLLLPFSNNGYAQISPGDLSHQHEQLEGLKNCTLCHVIGGKVSDDRCLECHKILKSMLMADKGYHATSEIKGRDCASCHSDHHGRNFNMVRFEEKDFDHDRTGFDLTGQHAGLDCGKCHRPDLVAVNELKTRKKTYLGLDTKCISCHSDVHQGTLSSDCSECHTTETFRPAVEFDHEKTDFTLLGRHREIECVSCHEITQKNGLDFQRFTGIEHGNCTSCHADVHHNRFGQNCRDCHNETSFYNRSSLKNFDHRMTGFALAGRHEDLDCRQCHKSDYTTPVPHDKCISCHEDYHRGQFNGSPDHNDCSACHSEQGFEISRYTIEDHQSGNFRLEGAHLATPCFSCHRKEDRWEFNEKGEKCVDCHNDEHAGKLDKKFYAGTACRNCHDINSWENIQFDHMLTGFALEGAHARQNCRSCHEGKQNGPGPGNVNFMNLPENCNDCHTDHHSGQFEKNGSTDCSACHNTVTWNASGFNHNSTGFSLSGQHAVISCDACHRKISEGGQSYVLYKIKNFECIDCHH